MINSHHQAMIIITLFAMMFLQPHVLLYGAYGSDGMEAGSQTTFSEVIDTILLSESGRDNASPSSIAINHKTNLLYVANRNGDSVVVINSTRNEVVQTILVGNGPGDIAVNSNTNTIYVNRPGSGNVVVIDAKTNQIIKTVEIGPALQISLDGIVVNEKNNMVYVLVNNNYSEQTGLAFASISIIDGLNNVLEEHTIYVAELKLDYDVMDSARGITINTETNTIYVVLFFGNMYVVDGNRGIVSDKVSIGYEKMPHKVTVNEKTNIVYTSNFGNQSISIVNGSNNEIMGTVEVGHDPQGAAIDTTSNRIYVVTYDNAITIIDGFTNKVINQIEVGEFPEGAAYNANNGFLYISNTGANSISVIDTRSELQHSFQLSVNETVYIESADFGLRLQNVTEDSRCPADVECVWAGQVTTAIEVLQGSSNTVLESFSLTLAGSDTHYLSAANADRYVVKLVRVDPYPVTTNSIQLSEYRVTLMVSTTDDHIDPIEYPSLSLASLELRTHENVPLDNQNAIMAGQKILLSSTISTVTGRTPAQDIVATYLVQARDEDNVVQFIEEYEFVISPISEVNIPWTPEQSGIYSIEVFVWRKTTDLSKDSFTPIMEKWKITNVFASPAKFVDAPQSELPAGIRLEIEKLGAREFYQDRDMWLPTQISVTRNDTIDWEMFAWPSIGPNYIISKLGSTPEQGSTIVYDYYKSLGIDSNNIQYDEFMKSVDIQPFPATSGRYFGFGWNQTNISGAKVSPGDYEAVLLMPILIGDISTGDDKRARILLASEPEHFTLLAGSTPNLEHGLVLKQTVNQTQLQTGERYEYSLVLVNEGDQQEYFSLISNPCPWEGPGGIVYPWYFNEHLGPGESSVITDGISEASKYPGAYYLNWSYVFAVPDEPLEGKSENDGVRVSCIEIQPNLIALEVTAPIYENVNLVLESDKQEFKRNETVHLSLYIENNSDSPFVLSEVVPELSITTPNGTKISLGWAADYFRPITVDPHSAFRLDNTFSLDWDLNDVYQIPPYLDDGNSAAEPGQYEVEATFVSPYLVSETITIKVIE